MNLSFLLGKTRWSGPQNALGLHLGLLRIAVMSNDSKIKEGIGPLGTGSKIVHHPLFCLFDAGTRNNNTKVFVPI